MLSISGPARESFAADVTVVRPIAGVGHHMLLQPMILREGLAALLAHEALPALVLQQDMLIQILLRDHPPLADLALVLGLEMRPLLMDVERIAVGASLAANIANYRALLVLETHVQPHVALHLELLTAILAIELVLGSVFAIEMFLQPTSALAFESARVARVFLRFYNSSATLAPPSDRVFRGMFPVEVRVKCRLVGTLVITEIATVCHRILHYVLLCYMHRVSMML